MIPQEDTTLCNNTILYYYRTHETSLAISTARCSQCSHNFPWRMTRSLDKFRGRRAYQIDGKDPSPPPGGWVAPSINSKQGKFLIEEYKNGLSTKLAPTAIWHKYPQLRCIEPTKFRKLKEGCVNAYYRQQNIRRTRSPPSIQQNIRRTRSPSSICSEQSSLDSTMPSKSNNKSEYDWDSDVSEGNKVERMKLNGPIRVKLDAPSLGSDPMAVQSWDQLRQRDQNNMVPIIPLATEDHIFFFVPITNFWIIF